MKTADTSETARTEALAMPTVSAMAIRTAATHGGDETGTRDSAHAHAHPGRADRRRNGSRSDERRAGAVRSRHMDMPDESRGGRGSARDGRGGGRHRSRSRSRDRRRRYDGESDNLCAVYLV